MPLCLRNNYVKLTVFQRCKELQEIAQWRNKYFWVETLRSDNQWKAHSLCVHYYCIRAGPIASKIVMQLTLVSHDRWQWWQSLNNSRGVADRVRGGHFQWVAIIYLHVNFIYIGFACTSEGKDPSVCLIRTCLMGKKNIERTYLPSCWKKILKPSKNKNSVGDWQAIWKILNETSICIYIYIYKIASFDVDTRVGFRFEAKSDRRSNSISLTDCFVWTITTTPSRRVPRLVSSRFDLVVCARWTNMAALAATFVTWLAAHCCSVTCCNDGALFHFQYVRSER